MHRETSMPRFRHTDRDYLWLPALDPAKNLSLSRPLAYEILEYFVLSSWRGGSFSFISCVPCLGFQTSYILWTFKECT